MKIDNNKEIVRHVERQSHAETVKQRSIGEKLCRSKCRWAKTPRATDTRQNKICVMTISEEASKGIGAHTRASLA